MTDPDLSDEDRAFATMPKYGRGKGPTPRERELEALLRECKQLLAALRAAYPVIVENASDWDIPGDLPREMLAAIQAAEPGWTPPVQFAFEAVPLHKLKAGELFRVSMHNPDTVTNRGEVYRAGSTKLGELLWCYPSGDRSPVIMSDTIKVHREVRPATEGEGNDAQA